MISESDLALLEKIGIPLLALMVGATVQWLVQKYRFNLEARRDHHRELKEHVLRIWLERVRESVDPRMRIGLTSNCSPVLLDDIRQNHYPDLLVLNAQVEEAGGDVQKKHLAILETIRSEFSQLANASHAPFGGALHEDQIAYYLGEKTHQAGISATEPRKVVSGTNKIAGGGSGNEYTVLYFDAWNSDSADTFLQAMTSWHRNPSFQKLLDAKQNAIRVYNKKRGDLERKLAILMHKTQLKGECDLMKP